MMKNIYLASTMGVVLLVGAMPASAQEKFFDPSASCSTVLSAKTNRAALWTFGYLAHLEGENREVSEGSIFDIVVELNAACKVTPDVMFSEFVVQTFGG